MWRCPHCGTPQAETARCWVCHRSSTACGTCRHFRRSVAAKVGYCGLDRRRAPLAGDEIRACWEPGGALTDATGGPLAPVFVPGRSDDQRREFVEVGSTATDAPAGPSDTPPAVEPLFEVPPGPTPSGEPPWSLWSDLEA
jgi:hypothetical protein